MFESSALSGIDMALWNLKGKKLGAPVYSLLGGRSRDRVRVYFHAHGKLDDELLDRGRRIMATGCTALRYSFETRIVRAHVRLPSAASGSGRWRAARGLLDALRKPPRWDSSVYVRDLLRVT